MIKKYIILYILCALTHFVYAQPLHTINGKITDAGSGRPVNNASVTLLSTKHTAITGDDGNFKLEGKAGDTLEVSHISYITRFIPIPATNNILSIKLAPANVLLEDVTINTGYQRLKPNEVNGSYVVIDNKTLNQQTGTNILDRLNGVTSSLLFSVGKQNNNPQNSTNISIRGLSTINGPLDPLIVIDNFIYDGDINNINPNDVESITILKDAAAASIWGARAGNGVIVITTKKGKFNQKVKLDFSTAIKRTEKPDLYYQPQISSADYINFQQYLFGQGFYDNLFTDYTHPAIPPAVQTFEDAKNGLISTADSASLINDMKNTDNRAQYMKYYYRKGVTQQYALNLSGGSQNIAWIISGTYDKDIDNLRAENNKTNIRFDNTYKPFKNMNISAGVYYTNSNSISGLPDYRSLISLNGNQQVPYLNLTGKDGQSIPVPHNYDLNYINSVGNSNLLNWNYYPLDDYKHNNTKTNTEELLANAGINYHVIKGLDFNLLFQYQKQKTETISLADTSSFYTRNMINLYTQVDNTTGNVNYIIPMGGILNKYYSTLHSYNFRGQLNFNRAFGNKNHISAIAGMETREVGTEGSNAVYYGYNADPLTYATNLDFYDYYPTITGDYATIPGTSALSETNNRFVSFFANASYTYKDKYILSASARRDGSNIFGANTNNKWKPLWSAGIGWDISKESFYKQDWLPYLKLSATYGVSGNVDLSKTALPIATTGINNFTGFRQEGISVINNPDLRWERAYQANFRLEFASSQNILNGSVEYYFKRGKDLYGPIPYDYTTFGLSATITANVADMKGNGVDIILHSNNINRGFKWSTDFLLNYNTSVTTNYYTSTATQLAAFIGDGATITPIIGKPLYAIAAYKWGGLDSQGNPQGYLNEELSTDYTGIQQSAFNSGLKGGSFVYMGPASPEYFGSLMNTFSFKGFSFSFNLTYKFHYYLFKPSLSYTGLANNGTNGMDYEKRWQKQGDENSTNVPSFIYPIDASRDNFYYYSTVNVIKGDHVRFQFANIAYNFLSNKEKLPFKEMQVYINAANLGILWRANKYHIDPDNIITIPSPTSYTIGIRTTF